MTIIEQIKAEIERRKGELKRYYNDDLIKFRAYDEMLSILSTLEPEKSMNQEGLEEEFSHYCFDFKDPDTGEDIPKNQISFNVEDALNVARHFAQWGAEHLKK